MPGNYGNDQPESDVGQRDLPAEQPPEHDQGDFVDHRRGYQERKCDSQRDARFHETQEKRYGTAGAKWREDAQRGRGHVAGIRPPLGQKLFGAFRRKEGADIRDHEDDHAQKQEYLDDVINKEIKRLATERMLRQAQKTVDQQISDILKHGEKTGLL